MPTNFGEVWKKGAELRHMSHLAHVWPELADIPINCCKLRRRVEFVHFSAKFGGIRCWPISINADRIWAESRLKEKHLGNFWTTSELPGSSKATFQDVWRETVLQLSDNAILSARTGRYKAAHITSLEPTLHASSLAVPWVCPRVCARSVGTMLIRFHTYPNENSNPMPGRASAAGFPVYEFRGIHGRAPQTSELFLLAETQRHTNRVRLIDRLRDTKSQRHRDRQTHQQTRQKQPNRRLIPHAPSLLHSSGARRVAAGRQFFSGGGAAQRATNARHAQSPATPSSCRPCLCPGRLA